MAFQKGRTHLIKLGASGVGGTLAGVKNLTVTINNEAVDITNKDSSGWRALLEGAGTQSVDISADGVASDGATYETLKGYAQSNSINTFQIVNPDTDALEGLFQITSFQEQSSHNNELAFSISLQSAGVITPTNA